MNVRRTFATLFMLGLAGAAIAAASGQAADRPDNRAGPLGVGAPATTPSVIRPDDRAGPLGVGAPATTLSVIRPDDRAGSLGVGDDVVSRYLNNHPAAVRPDDRGGIRGVGDDVVSRYLNNHPAAVRPDDRGGIRGVGTGTAGVVTPASAHDESFWGAGQLAGVAFLGAIAMGLLGFALMRHRRSAVAALQS